MSSRPRSRRCACWRAARPTCAGVAHIRGHETDRIAALATEFNALGGNVTETEDGLTIRPTPLNGGPFRTYADHRMAHAGVILGLAVPGVQVENIATTAKTFPGFADAWSSLYRADAEVRRVRRRVLRPAAPAHPPPDEGPARATTTPCDGRVVTVDRGRYTTLVDGRMVTAMKSRPLGRKGVVVGDEVRMVGDVSGDDGSLARIVEVERAPLGAAPDRGRRRPGGAGDRRERRPARRGDRAGRPRAADRG